MNQFQNEIAIAFQRFRDTHQIRVVVVEIAVLQKLVAARKTTGRQESTDQVGDASCDRTQRRTLSRNFRVGTTSGHDDCVCVGIRPTRRDNRYFGNLSCTARDGQGGIRIHRRLPSLRAFNRIRRGIIVDQRLGLCVYTRDCHTRRGKITTPD